MARRALTEGQKTRWLYKFDGEIRKAMRACATKRPADNNHFAPGHMFMHDGLSPRAAARRYLQQTRYGRMSCVRIPR